MVTLGERLVLVIVPFVSNVGAVEVGIFGGARSEGVVTVAATYLAAGDVDGGVALHMSVLGAAIDGTLHKGRTTDGDLGLVDIVQVGNQRLVNLLLRRSEIEVL